MDIRVIKKTVDITNDIIDFYGNAVLLDLLTGESLFIGLRFPANSIYFKVKTPNDLAGSISIGLWNTVEFRNVAEINDQTGFFSKSGKISFEPNKNESWQRQDTEHIAELNTFDIYDRYWIKITALNDLNPLTEIQWCGQMLLESDADIENEHPILSRTSLKSAFKAGKTTWEDQRFKASELVIQDLIAKNIIIAGEQILDTEKLKNATVARCAQIIYGAFGDDYLDQAQEAQNEYKRRTTNMALYIDRTNTAKINDVVVHTRELRMSR